MNVGELRRMLSGVPDDGPVLLGDGRGGRAPLYAVEPLSDLAETPPDGGSGLLLRPVSGVR